ncbi:MAG: MFS transporter [Proteobacteria bacterium]|nr:MAG: MFS transporter [Pseudomonadota bacterium]
MTRRIIIATLIKLLINTGRRFAYPFAPALSRELAVPLTSITTILATGQAVSLLGLFSGPLADRTGYRFMMRSGLAMLAIGMLVCGLVPHYIPVFTGLVVASFGKTIFDPAIQAFIGHTIPYSKRGRVVGIIEMSWAGSTLIGIPALALIIDHAGFRTAFFLFTLTAGIGWAAMASVIPKENVNTGCGPQKNAPFFIMLWQLLKQRTTAGMLAFAFWISLANDCLFVTYGAWFEEAFLASIVTIGFSTIAIGSAEFLGESLTALFADRIGLQRALIIGLILSSSSYLLIPLIGHSLIWAMVSIFFVFLTFEFMIVTSFSLCTELLPESRATMMAGFYASAGIGRMIGVMLGGLLWQFGGINWVAIVSAVITGIGLLSALWGLASWQAEPAETRS